MPRHKGGVRAYTVYRRSDGRVSKQDLDYGGAVLMVAAPTLQAALTFAALDVPVLGPELMLGVLTETVNNGADCYQRLWCSCIVSYWTRWIDIPHHANEQTIREVMMQHRHCPQQRRQAA